MAVNKRKVLEAAQKYLQKGALDKALKEYKTLLEVEPRDANLRLKVGDIHLRRGEKDEAIAAYLKVADQFMRDGFDAKAVALYKQIAKLDAARLDIYLPLADLYQRMGLASEAMGALQTAADACHRQGRKREALDLLRKMASLDPTNTTSRMKIADLLRRADQLDDALAEYDEVVAELTRQGEPGALITAYERILELKPERTETILALARTLSQQRWFKRAEPLAKRALETKPDSTEAHELLVEIYQGLGRADQVAASWRRLAEIHRERGDEERARDIQQRFLANAPMLAGAPAGSASGAAPGAGEPLVLDDAFAQDDTSDLVRDTEPLRTDAGPKARHPKTGLEERAAPPLVPESGPLDADPEQLLAEASVYLRYGKHGKAVASLEKLLAVDSEHRGALEKLGEAYVAARDPRRAVEAWSRAAKFALVEADAEGYQALRERIAAIDAAAAAKLRPIAQARASAPAPAPAAPARPAGPAAAARANEFGDLELDLGEGGVLEQDTAGGDEGGAGDVEIDVDPFALDVDVSEAAQASAAGAESAVASGAEIELDSDDDSFLLERTGIDEPTQPSLPPRPAAPAAPVAPAAPAVPVAPRVAAPAAAQAAVVASRPAAPAAVRAAAVTPKPAAPAPKSAPPVSVSPQQILDDLDEGDFYFTQALYDEAEAVYRRVLSGAPNHPQALLRLGEIAAARGQDPGDANPTPDAAGEAPEEMQAGPREAGELELEGLESILGDDLPAFGEPLEGDGADEAASGSIAHAAQTDTDERDAQRERDTLPLPLQPHQPEADLDSGPGGTSAAFDLAEVLEEVAAEDAREEEAAAQAARAAAAESSEDWSEDTAPDFAPPEADAPVDASGEAAFDLAAELSESLSAQQPGAGAARGRAGTEEDAFESLFREFKRGVSRTLQETDHEAHYDLGIAYREMGLFEDAISEFRIALEAPARQRDCLHMLGLCALALHRPQDAAAHLEQALSLPGVPVPQQIALRFDQGRAFELLGERARALAAYRAVAAIDERFQDVSERLQALESQSAQAPEAPEAPAEPSEAVETYESFDDLIAEADVALGGDAEASQALGNSAPDALASEAAAADASETQATSFEAAAEDTLEDVADGAQEESFSDDTGAQIASFAEQFGTGSHEPEANEGGAQDDEAFPIGGLADLIAPEGDTSLDAMLSGEGFDDAAETDLGDDVETDTRSGGTDAEAEPAGLEEMEELAEFERAFEAPRPAVAVAAAKTKPAPAAPASHTAAAAPRPAAAVAPKPAPTAPAAKPAAPLAARTAAPVAAKPAAPAAAPKPAAAPAAARPAAAPKPAAAPAAARPAAAPKPAAAPAAARPAAPVAAKPAAPAVAPQPAAPPAAARPTPPAAAKPMAPALPKAAPAAAAPRPAAPAATPRPATPPAASRPAAAPAAARAPAPRVEPVHAPQPEPPEDGGPIAAADAPKKRRKISFV